MRVFYSLFAAIFSLLSPAHVELMRSNAFTETLHLPNHSIHYLLLDVWGRFDTLWYLHIAQHGYDLPASTVFYPLYPVLIKVTGGYLVSALCISTLASFFLFWGFQELFRLDFSTESINRSLLIFALWPASFIYFAGYAESLLLAFILWSLYAARRNYWWLAASLAFFACTTKAAGMLVFVPLAVLALRSRAFKSVWILLAPLGLAGFLFWLRRHGFDTPSHIYAQYWRTKISFPWTTLWSSCQVFVHSHGILLGLNLLFLLLFCWLVFATRAEWAYTLFGVAAVLLFLTKQTDPPLQSTIRYLLIIFPVYMGLGRWFESPALRPRFDILCTILLVANLGLLWLFLGWSLVL